MKEKKWLPEFTVVLAIILVLVLGIVYDSVFRNRQEEVLGIVYDSVFRNRQEESNGELFSTKVVSTHTSGDYEYELHDDGKAVISSYNGKAAEVSVPSSLDNHEVKGIAECAFSYCNMTKVTIPDTVTGIGSRAFDGCAHLTEIRLSDNLTSIQYGAFRQCTSLASIDLPEKLTTIGDEAFEYCRLLSVITIPKNVKYFGKAVFYECENLTDIMVSEKNPNFRSVDGVMFDRAGTAIVSYPAGRKDARYSVPDGVTMICEGTFKGQAYLQEIVIPSGVTELRDGVFAGCSALKSIDLPASVATIAANAFSDCDSLSAINADDGNVHFRSIDGVLFSRDATVLIRYPAGKTSSSYAIPNTVNTIGNTAFGSCICLTSVKIPWSVTRIEDNAFCFCDGLIEMTIPSSVVYLGEKAFYMCGNLTSVTIPGSVKTIRYCTFDSCSSLSHVEIQYGVEEIGLEPFRDCIALKDIVLPDSVKKLGTCPFYGTGLKHLVIPAGVTDMSNVIECAYQLETILVSEDNPVYGVIDNILYDKTNNTLIGLPYKDGREIIEIPSFITSIGHSAFIENRTIRRVVIPNGVSAIGNAAFRDCSALEDVVIPSGVTTIGDQAFLYCENLTTAALPDGLLWIGESAFCGCRGLTDVYIPASVTGIGKHAFDGWNYSIQGNPYRYPPLENLNIIVHSNSYAERYCIDNNIPHTYCD